MRRPQAEFGVAMPASLPLRSRCQAQQKLPRSAPERCVLVTSVANGRVCLTVSFARSVACFRLLRGWARQTRSMCM